MNASPLDIPKLVADAEARIRPHVRTTGLERSNTYSRATGANVYLKLENRQHTGSFKVRGALNRILAMTDAERRRGVVAASTGNHGKAVAFALERVGAQGEVFVPRGASASKTEAIRALGAKVRIEGADSVEAERSARTHASQHGATYVSPYNDPLVIGGQGTIGIEIAEQLESIDAVVASVGGGGLIAGVAGHLKAIGPDIEVIGCSPTHSKVMYESVRAGRILDLASEPTLSDGTAGGIEPGAITFGPCARLIDRFVTVDEPTIATTLRDFVAAHSMRIEGSAAVAVAGCLACAQHLKGKNVAVILCGGNIGNETLASVLGVTPESLEREHPA